MSSHGVDVWKSGKMSMVVLELYIKLYILNAEKAKSNLFFVILTNYEGNKFI